MFRRDTLLVTLAALTLLTGCPATMPCCVDEVDKRRWADLPPTQPELIAFSRERVRDDSPDADLVRGVMAACRALKLQPDDGEAAVLGAMGCFELRDRGTIPDWLWRDCVPLSEVAVARRPLDARAQYTLALNVGLETQNQNPKDALLNVGWILSALDVAMAEDEALDEGGPLRVMGLLYLRAPSWPTSIGDPDKAHELLTRAAASYPAHPLNHLALAESRLVDADYEAALAALADARRVIDPTKHHWRAERYTKRADELEAKVKAGLGVP